jgi:hypothetical protein
MESAIPKGLHFHSVISVGNSAQTGVEEMLAYLDENYDPQHSPNVKLLYLENIRNPDKLLHHAASLIRKGCKIAAIKAGSSEAGSRAATYRGIGKPRPGRRSAFPKSRYRKVLRTRRIDHGSMCVHEQTFKGQKYGHNYPRWRARRYAD